MEILVCIKQVPDTTEIRIDPETNTLIRTGVPSIMNPFDAYAVEQALQLKEMTDGRVTVVTMGPPQAKSILGDALAMVLLDRQGFTKSDYGRLHPGGAIGRMVTLRAMDIMRDLEHTAIVPPEAKVRDALYRMSHARCGSAIVVAPDNRLLGIFTDGDFRRWCEKDMSVLERLMSEVMTPKPVTVKAEQLAVEVLKTLETRHVDDIVVVDDGGVVQGFIDVQDLPGLKLM